jgi:hypothetical protein
MLLSRYRVLLVGGLLLIALSGLYFYISGLKSQIVRLKNEAKDNSIELANEKLQSTRYRYALDKLNKEVEDARLNESLALKELNKWKSQPPKIKYKTITKIREVRSDDCKELKSVIDTVRSIDYSSL